MKETDGHSRLHVAQTNGFYSRPALKRLENDSILIPEASPKYSVAELEKIQTLATIRRAGVSFQSFMELVDWIMESRLTSPEYRERVVREAAEREARIRKQMYQMLIERSRK